MVKIHNLDRHFDHVPMIQNVNNRDLQKIKDWVKKTQPQLPYVSDRQISIFLHSCYGSINLTKDTIAAYYKRRTETNFFTDRKREDFLQCFSSLYIVKVPVLSTDKCHIICTGFVDPHPSKFQVLECIKTFFAISDIYSNLIPYASGWRLCLDMEGFSFGHCIKITSHLNNLKNLIYYVQDSLPIRLRGIHVRNANSFFHHILAIAKPFMKKELYDMIYIHTASESSLYDYIPPEALPYNNDEGKGEAAEKLINDTLEILETYKQWLEDDQFLARIDKLKLPQSSTQSMLFSFSKSLMNWNATNN